MGWNSVWDEVYREHRWGRHPPEEVLRFVARNFYAAPDRKDVRLLEVGCGPAATLWYLAREGFSAFGLDGSAVALEKAAQRLAEEGVKADLKQGDAVRLPYPDVFFDGVLDIECIYANSKKDSHRIIKEIFRVLKPGGAFFSKTFMTGSCGDGEEKTIEGEPHTYAGIPNNAMHIDRGVVRFTAEDEIPELYGSFSAIEYDYVIRSDNNRKQEIKEWLITCRK